MFNLLQQAAPPKIDTGDTAWVLISTALVMLMTPALAFFYGGLVRRKNVLSTIMHSFFSLAVVSVVWVLWGYSLSFGKDTGLGIIGGLDWFGLAGVTGINTDYAPTIPHALFMMFQMMFAAITPALISGAFAERMKFSKPWCDLHGALWLINCLQHPWRTWSGARAACSFAPNSAAVFPALTSPAAP